MLRHMYGLKNEIDLSFLTRFKLIQVAIGVYQDQFGRSKSPAHRERFRAAECDRECDLHSQIRLFFCNS